VPAEDKPAKEAATAPAVPAEDKPAKEAATAPAEGKKAN
jgi:hypothetical protein